MWSYTWHQLTRTDKVLHLGWSDKCCHTTIQAREESVSLKKMVTPASFHELLHISSFPLGGSTDKLIKLWRKQQSVLKGPKFIWTFLVISSTARVPQSKLPISSGQPSSKRHLTPGRNQYRHTNVCDLDVASFFQDTTGSSKSSWFFWQQTEQKLCACAFGKFATVHELPFLMLGKVAETMVLPQHDIAKGLHLQKQQAYMADGYSLWQIHEAPNSCARGWNALAKNATTITFEFLPSHTT